MMPTSTWQHALSQTARVDCTACAASPACAAAAPAAAAELGLLLAIHTGPAMAALWLIWVCSWVCLPLCRPQPLLLPMQAGWLHAPCTTHGARAVGQWESGIRGSCWVH